VAAILLDSSKKEMPRARKDENEDKECQQQAA
jgi:hypothetical protein